MKSGDGEKGRAVGGRGQVGRRSRATTPWQMNTFSLVKGLGDRHTSTACPVGDVLPPHARRIGMIVLQRG